MIILRLLIAASLSPQLVCATQEVPTQDVPLENLLSLPSRANLRSHLYNLTRRSHVAGTPGDYHDAHYVLHALSSLPGFEAHIENVDVMLTYPSGRPHLVAPDIGYVAWSTAVCGH